MIGCRVARRQMPELLRSDLGEAARLELERHLQGCAPCRQARAQWGLLGALQRSSQSLTPAAEKRIVANLVAAAREQRAPSAQPARRWPVPMLAAAVLIVCVWFGWRQLQPRSFAEGEVVES